MDHVYIVEDEQLIRTMVKINLERQGYTVHCFDNAEAMLDALQPGQHGVLLLDIMLPGMDGDEALTELRRRGIDIPVLMLTARRDIETKVKTLEQGADDYLPKPFDMDELLARVRVLLRRRPRN